MDIGKRRRVGGKLASMYSAVFNPAYRQIFRDMIGKTQKQNSQQIYTNSIRLENYYKRGNERALADWNRNVGSKGRTIRYPEFSYPGAIRRSDTSIANALLGYATADANYTSHVGYSAASHIASPGLYSSKNSLYAGGFSKLSRYL